MRSNLVSTVSPRQHRTPATAVRYQRLVLGSRICLVTRRTTPFGPPWSPVSRSHRDREEPVRPRPSLCKLPDATRSNFFCLVHPRQYRAPAKVVQYRHLVLGSRICLVTRCATPCC